MNIPSFFITKLFAQLALWPWKNLLAGFLILLGLGAIGGGGYFLWQSTKITLCPQVERIEVPALSSNLPTFSQQITVDLGGAINNPGLYEVSASARLAEAIKLAGGFSPEVDQAYLAENVNLASTLIDGQKIYIPFTGEQKTTQINSSNAQNCISLNSASQTELTALIGVGEARSADIVANRPYQSLEEVIEKGVLTESIFKDNQQLMCL